MDHFKQGPSVGNFDAGSRLDSLACSSTASFLPLTSPTIWIALCMRTTLNTAFTRKLKAHIRIPTREVNRTQWQHQLPDGAGASQRLEMEVAQGLLFPTTLLSLVCTTCTVPPALHKNQTHKKIKSRKHKSRNTPSRQQPVCRRGGPQPRSQRRPTRNRREQRHPPSTRQLRLIALCETAHTSRN